MKSRIRILGPDGGSYKLGQPMCVHEGATLIATLDPVRILNDATAIHIADFKPAAAVVDERRPIGRWMFCEICMFISERFPQIQTIGFAFPRPLGGEGYILKSVETRSEILERIGVADLRIDPLTSGAHVVSGFWHYSERNIAAVREVLQEQRAIYRNDPIVKRKKDRSLLRRIRHWISR